MTASAIAEPRCPNCGLSESVKNVSVAAVSSAPEDLALARRIEPPIRPRYRSPWGLWSKAAVGLLVLGLVVVLVATEENVSMLRSAGTPVDPLFAYLLISTAVFLVPIGLIVASKERQRAIRQEELSIQMSAWGRSMDQWERLYHCERCDGVFSFDRYWLVPTDDMEKSLQEAVAKSLPDRAAAEPRLAG